MTSFMLWALWVLTFDHLAEAELVPPLSALEIAAGLVVAAGLTVCEIILRDKG